METVHAEHSNVPASKEMSLALLDAQDEVRRQDELIHNLLCRIHTLRDEERKSIAFELHDTLGQELSAINMSLATLAARPRSDEDLGARIAQLRDLVQAAMLSARKISTRLRPEVLEAMGLCLAVETQVREFEQRTGITCTCKIDTAIAKIGTERFRAFLFILRESLTNIERHADATQIVVTLGTKHKIVELCVIDNGKGITADDQETTTAFGILAMKAQAKNNGGSVSVERLATRGTRVTAHIPGTIQ